MSNYMSYTNAVDVVTAIGNKLKALAGAYIPRGNTTFAGLPATITSSMLGYVYNVTNAFTTDSRFAEGSGKSYPAGSNVAVVNVGTSATPDLKYDVLGGFIDISSLETKIAAVESMITDTFSTSTAYAVGDVVIYNDGLYKFKTAHAAGAWNSAEVDEVNIIDLILAAEPDSLTTAQVNDLIALLG